MADEVARPEEFKPLFSSADSLHANFYNNFKPEVLVRTDINDVKRLPVILGGIG